MRKEPISDVIRNLTDKAMATPRKRTRGTRVDESLFAMPKTTVRRGTKAVKFDGTWADPDDKTHDHMGKVMFFGDGVCECGVRKHHYHCAVCRRIVQVG